MKKLFVLGDSISIHYGPFLEQMLKGEFEYSRKSGEEQALKNLDIPQGANGGDSRMCLEFLKGLQATSGLDVDILLLNCGLHDVKAPIIPEGQSAPAQRQLQVTLKDYQSNLKQIIQIVKALQTRLIWVRTTPVDEAQHNKPESGIFRYAKDVDTYNAAADKIMTEAGVSMIDLSSFTKSLGPVSQTLYDGRHFHEPIRQLQAAYIAGWLATV